MACCSNYQKFHIYDTPTCLITIEDENGNIKAEFLLKETTILNQSDDQVTLKSPSLSYTIKAIGLVDHNDVSRSISYLVNAIINQRGVCLDV